MVLEPIHCPDCGGIEVIKHGTTPDGKQRWNFCGRNLPPQIIPYFRQNSECSRRTFIMQYTYSGYLPEVKQQISDMAMNGSGIRDPARVLHVSPTTGKRGVKKKINTLKQSMKLNLPNWSLVKPSSSFASGRM